jgi:hypothetical protein
MQRRAASMMKKPPHIHKGRPHLLVIALVIALVLLATGCREPPETVLQNARDALGALGKISCGDKERLQDGLDELARYVEPKAAKLLLAAPDVARTSTGQFSVFVTCKPPPTVIPVGEVVKVEAEATVAKVWVKGKGSKGNLLIPMQLVDGRWKIALLDMDSFAAAIRVREK